MQAKYVMRFHLMMRTTLDIEDDILCAVKSLAKRERKSAGQAIPELARKGLAGVPATEGSKAFCKYEDNVLDLMMEDLGRLWRGETPLKNEFA